MPFIYLFQVNSVFLNVKKRRWEIQRTRDPSREMPATQPLQFEKWSRAYKNDSLKGLVMTIEVAASVAPTVIKKIQLQDRLEFQHWPKQHHHA